LWGFPTVMLLLHVPLLPQCIFLRKSLCSTHTYAVGNYVLHFIAKKSHKLFRLLLPEKLCFLFHLLIYVCQYRFRIFILYFAWHSDSILCLYFCSKCSTSAIRNSSSWFLRALVIAPSLCLCIYLLIFGGGRGVLSYSLALSDVPDSCKFPALLLGSAFSPKSSGTFYLENGISNQCLHARGVLLVVFEEMAYFK
jgi:hypothetical protein